MLLDRPEKWGEGEKGLSFYNMQEQRPFVILSPYCIVLSAGRRPFAFLFIHSFTLKCTTSKFSKGRSNFFEITMGTAILCILKFE
jgi:hypothetical protein